MRKQGFTTVFNEQHNMNKNLSQAQSLGGQVMATRQRCEAMERYYLNPRRCKQCNSIITIPDTQKAVHARYKKFCNKSCAAIWNNAHKSKGTRVSKLERWLAIKLCELYPNLDFHFNRKDAIDGELDIFIPSFKLAFELNGIFHYEPIYGPEKLKSIRSNDTRKFQACIERGIELCVVDVSGLTYFKEQKAAKYLDIICQLISNKLVAGTGV